MTETQDEKELILGNKQLISLFFVVVALCGVCFATGYIIGHNSKPVTAEAPQTQAAPVAQDAAPARETPAAGDATAAPNPAAAQDSAAPQPADPSVPADQTAVAGPASDEGPKQSAATEAAAPQPTASQPAILQSAKDSAESVRASAPAAPSPSGSGSYLQVGAVSKIDAENLVKTLREQNLPALMAESPKKGLFRVLVGPYRQTADIAEAKSRLKTLGFDNAFVQK
jgi:cell division septation protein DedD